MTTTVVRYKIKEGRGDENQELVEAVFAELTATSPDSFSYGTMRLEDGLTFVHIARVDGDDNPLNDSPAFKKFVDALPDRCDEPPLPLQGTLIGNYGLYT
ncbi:MAG: hypothetical protein ACR2QO_00820 [Acidimicrobiales bacterium]